MKPNKKRNGKKCAFSNSSKNTTLRLSCRVLRNDVSFPSLECAPPPPPIYNLCRKSWRVGEFGGWGWREEERTREKEAAHLGLSRRCRPYLQHPSKQLSESCLSPPRLLPDSLPRRSCRDLACVCVNVCVTRVCMVCDVCLCLCACVCAC